VKREDLNNNNRARQEKHDYFLMLLLSLFALPEIPKNFFERNKYMYIRILDRKKTKMPSMKNASNVNKPID